MLEPEGTRPAFTGEGCSRWFVQWVWIGSNLSVVVGRIGSTVLTRFVLGPFEIFPSIAGTVLNVYFVRYLWPFRSLLKREQFLDSHF